MGPAPTSKLGSLAASKHLLWKPSRAGFKWRTFTSVAAIWKMEEFGGRTLGMALPLSASVVVTCCALDVAAAGAVVAAF